MAIARALVVVAFLVALRIVRRTRPIGRCTVELFDHRRQQCVKQILVRLLAFRRLENLLRLLFQFIVAAPERQAGAMGNALDLIFGFAPNGIEKWFVTPIKRTGKHEIMPDQQSFLVA